MKAAPATRVPLNIHKQHVRTRWQTLPTNKITRSPLAPAGRETENSVIPPQLGSLNPETNTLRNTGDHARSGGGEHEKETARDTFKRQRPLSSSSITKIKSSTRLKGDAGETNIASPAIGVGLLRRGNPSVFAARCFRQATWSARSLSHVN